jgi:hypothetical protein
MRKERKRGEGTEKSKLDKCQMNQKGEQKKWRKSGERKKKEKMDKGTN